MSEKMEEYAINPSNGNEFKNKSDVFNLVIGIATLLIAILGATFAYFTATARSNEGDVQVKSAYVSISYDGGTQIKASNLIPSTRDIMLSKFQREALPYDPTVDGDELKLDYDTDGNNDTDRRCVDARGKQVCYVYQFSIESDGSAGEFTDILAYIETKKNDFYNLSYSLYEVELKTDAEDPTKVLVDKYGINLVESYILVSEFNDPDEGILEYTKFERPDDEFDENGSYLGTTYPVACLYGHVDESESVSIGDPARCKPYPVENQKKHTYQLVVWLNETGSVQEEQGFTFEGTVVIEVIGGLSSGEYGDGKITGVQ